MVTIVVTKARKRTNKEKEKREREREKNAMKLKNDAKFFRVRSTLSLNICIHTYIEHKKRGET